MNLNERIINHGNKSKLKTKFITTGNFVENKNNVGNFTSNGQRKPTKSKKINSTVQSASNWGSACTSIVTTSSGRRVTSNSTEEAQSRTVIALTEGRGQAKCEVGIAVIKISTPVLVVCQISDSQNYINTLTKINIFNPSEIIFPSTFENFGGSRLITKIKEHFPKLRYTGIPRSLFNKTSGLDMISKLCIPSLNGVVLVLRHRYYALAATSGLLSYIQDNLYIYYASGSLTIDYQESEGYALIDVATADRLELVCSAKPAQANKYSTLFGILNHCYTKMGTRVLRSWILQPLFKVSYIKARLDCVDEFMRKRHILSPLEVLLHKLSNIDSLLNITTVVAEDPQKCSIRQLNYILNLNSIIDLVIPLRELLCDLKEPFFVKLRKTLEDPSFMEIREMVRQILTEDAQNSKDQLSIHSRCYCIKPKINGLLDVVRKIYSERVSDMKEYVQLLAEKYNLALSLGNNQKKGYHIKLNLNKRQSKSFKKSDLPEEFIEVHCSTNSFTMKTPELTNISTRVDDILEDILKINNAIVYNVMVDIKKFIPLFYKLCEEIAQLDVYQSLAQTSLENNYIRPEFGEYTEVKNSQHPLLNFLLPTKPVANTICCSDDYNVHIITGPNGSGKSVFIRQVMLLQIMAQIGSYIPAEWAIFKPANKMFARIYLNDNMEYNASSFVLEMKEIKYIMNSMTKDSLVIIDELARSTSAEEGVSLAIAILEAMSYFSTYVFITTHFTMFVKFSSIYPHIKSWEMETVPNGDDPKTFKLDYRYSLIPGVTKIRRYGAYVIRNIWPEAIVKIVDNSLDQLEKAQHKSIFIPMDQRSVVKYNTESELRQLKRKNVLFISTIKEVILKYQENLNNLNFDIPHDKLNANPNLEEIKLEQPFDQIFSPDFLELHDQEIPRINFNFHKNINNEESLDNSQCQSDDSEFIKMLHPNIILNENPQNSQILQLVTPKQYSNDISNTIISKDNVGESWNKNMSQNSSYRYISPIVNIVEGLNNPTPPTPLNSTFSDNQSNLLENDLNSKPEKNIQEGKREENFPFTSPNLIQNKFFSFENSNMINQYENTATEERVSNQYVFTHLSSSLHRNNYYRPNNFNASYSSDSKLGNNVSTDSKDYRDREKSNQCSKNVECLKKIPEPAFGNIQSSFNNDSFEILYKRNDCGFEKQHSDLQRKRNFDSDLQSNSSKRQKACFESCRDNTLNELSQISNEQGHSSKTDFSSSFEKKNLQTSIAEISDIISNTKHDLSSISNENKQDPSFLKNASKTGNERIKTFNKEFNQPNYSQTASDSNTTGKCNIDTDSTSTNVNSDNQINLFSTASKPEDLEQSVDDVEHVSQNLNSVQSTSHTGVSTASKKRNLDSSSDSTSNNRQTSCNTNDKNKELLQTSISSASRYRNLDSVASSSKSADSSETSNEAKNPKKEIKKRRVFRKFIPPQKLSAKEIKKEFYEQDKKIFNGTETPDLDKYLEQRMNRPTVKQIQTGTYVGAFRRTTNGFEVLVPEPEIKKTISKTLSNETIDMRIFSEKNANAFEQFINSEDTDFRNFHFNGEKNLKKTYSLESETIIDYYMANSQTNKSNQSQNRNNSIFSSDGYYKQNKEETIKSSQSQNNNFSMFSPDGYYKQNKEEINNVMKKYLDNNSSSSRY